MAPFWVPKNFKFKLSFSGGPNETLNLLPLVPFSTQRVSNNTPNLIQITILKIREMERNMLNLWKKNPKKLMKNLCVGLLFSMGIISFRR
jgi:hypothetical protein